MYLASEPIKAIAQARAGVPDEKIVSVIFVVHDVHRR
jgi:hypothetical protein